MPSSYSWSVTYGTARVRCGVAPTRTAAELEAVRFHDSLVIQGLSEHELAYHVSGPHVADSDPDGGAL
jgi:hypothetical protein